MTENDEDDAEPPVELTVHVFIPKNTPAASMTRPTRRGTTATECIQKGPFEVLSTDTYPQFLRKLAVALPCRPENIHETKIEWKPKKPANEVKLVLGKATGYKSMMKEMLKKKDCRTILLYMPASAEPMEDDAVSASCAVQQID